MGLVADFAHGIKSIILFGLKLLQYSFYGVRWYFLKIFEAYSSYFSNKEKISKLSNNFKNRKFDSEVL